MDYSLEQVRRLDRADPLAALREHFHLPAPGQIYLDGNSLGLLPIAAEAAVQRVLNEWKTLAIGGWLDAAPPWFTLAESLAAQVAALVGARGEEVALANSTTVNLHQLLATVYPDEGSNRTRTKILAYADEFPSDLYAIASFLRGRGLAPKEHLVLVPSAADGLIGEETVCRMLTDDSALRLAVLPAVVYTTGQLLDVRAITAAARAAGVLVGFDLSHSVGVVPHRLSDDGVDFAFWCHYKYLNSGPGAPGGLYLNARHADRAPGLAGWWGSHKERMFDMGRELDPAHGAAALQIGTPTVLGLAAIDGALGVTEEAGLARIREKSLRLTTYLMERLETRLPFAEVGFRFANPREDHRRGGHVALTHPEGARLCKALKAAGVMTDFRPPDIVRFAPVPLYNTFEECHETAERLRTIWETGAHLQFPAGRNLVA